jgi:Ca2+-binding EF-hand superfamily protein
MAKFDKSGSGRLDKSELFALLTEQACGTEPTQEELDFVLCAADESDGRMNGHVNKHELEAALEVWLALRDSKPKVEAYMTKYDVDHNGELSKNELKALLQDLNDGVSAQCSARNAMQACRARKSLRYRHNMYHPRAGGFR